MFAVIKTGGKQYPVRVGNIIKVEKLEGNIGNIITFDNVLFANDNNVQIDDFKQVKVKAEILEQKRNKKIIVFKKRRRKNYKRKNGHRQYCTILRIIGVDKNGN
ncbi:MAG: 50S ribosomal protein L21 [Rickettsiaceae bacterium H1]|nr:50S ribosomal protein L21 [Rickettsiaceae bacterium H1]